jgi:gas vesicle protein
MKIMENKNLIAGLLAGVAIGMVVGWMFAPEEIEKAVKKGAAKLKDKSQDLIDDLEKTVVDKFEKGAEEVSRKAKSTIKSANEGLSY